MQNPLEYAERIAYSSKATLHFTYEMAKKFKYAPGVFVEAGVAAGAQIIAMRYGAKLQEIFAFDSYQGIPLPSNRDDQMPGIAMLSKTEQMLLPDPGKQVLESSGATSVPLEDVKNHILASGLGLMEIYFVEGWFEETVHLFNSPISLLRLDGDLYNSTWVCLQHLFPKVIKGGCVILDDIQLPGCKAATDEYFELIGYQPDWKYISNIAYFYK